MGFSELLGVSLLALLFGSSKTCCAILRISFFIIRYKEQYLFSGLIRGEARTHSIILI